MSQWGPAPRPASRRSSKSPGRDTRPSPQSSQPSIASRDDPSAFGQQQDSRGHHFAPDGDERGRPTAARTSGMHNILNSPEPHSSQAGGQPPVPGHAATEAESYGAATGIRQQLPPVNSSPSPYQFQSQAAPQSYFPPSSQPPGSMATLGRRSPIGGNPFPPLGPGPARRILTPRSPRASSMGRAAARSMEMHGSPVPPLPQALGPGMATTGEAPPPGSGQQHYAPAPQGSGSLHQMVTSAPPPPPAPTRSLSQPVLSHSLLTSQGQEPQALYPGGRPPPVSQTYHPPPPPAPHHLGAHDGAGRGTDSMWGPRLMGSVASAVAAGGGRGVSMVDGQHVITITPSEGEEILVPIDYHQASKQADEKRQRNAGASARFRQRKKEREREQQEGLQKLDTQNKDLERRVQELTMERDYYRGERNRLRDIVRSTPAISEWADRGPPSPTSSRSGGSFAAESSPHPAAASAPLTHPHAHAHAHGHSHAHQQQQPPPPLPQSYPHPHQPPPSHAISHPHPSSAYPAGDPSMLERPARRRRTDPEPQFTTPSYGPPVPGSLPPIPPPVYGLSPSPHPSSSPGSARLPPLRFDQPSPGSEHPPTPPAVSSALPGAPTLPPSVPPPPMPQSHYPPNTRAPYETGWATGPRPGGPHDGGHR